MQDTETSTTEEHIYDDELIDVTYQNTSNVPVIPQLSVALSLLFLFLVLPILVYQAQQPNRQATMYA